MHRVGDLKNFKPTVAESFQEMFDRCTKGFNEARTDLAKKDAALQFELAQRCKRVEDQLGDTDAQLKTTTDQVIKFNQLASVLITCLYTLRGSLNDNNTKTGLPQVGLDWPDDEGPESPAAKKQRSG